MEQLKDAPITFITLFFWIVISISLIYYLLKNRKNIHFISGISYIIILFGSLSINSFLYTKIAEFDFSLTEETWKKDYLTPYLDSRAEKHTPVEVISLTPDSTQQPAQSISLTNKNLSQVLVRPLGTDDEILIKVKIETSSTDQPYLSYKKIEKDITAIYQEDVYYEPVLYISLK